MTPHERDLILKVADEVRAADRSAVDPEAERLIRAEVAAQPHAAYILTQRVIVQDLALQQARSRIDELEARLRQAGLPAGGPGAPPAQAAPPSSRSGVGDFLRTAAAAAAGTIGGQLIYDGLRHWAAGHGGPGGFGGPTGGGFLPTGPGRSEPDIGPGTDDRDWGGGADYGTDPAADDEATGAGGDWGDESADESDDTPDDDLGGGDWGDDGSDDSAGGGGDW